jgi:hypothetical protein
MQMKHAPDWAIYLSIGVLATLLLVLLLVRAAETHNKRMAKVTIVFFVSSVNRLFLLNNSRFSHWQFRQFL